MKNIKHKKIMCVLGLFIFIELLNFFNIRICLIYNIFHIPCVGCGLTRGTTSLFSGNIHQAIQYNWLSVLLPILILVVGIWKLLDFIYKKKTFNDFIRKNRVLIIIISFIIAIISEIININNPLLY